LFTEEIKAIGMKMEIHAYIKRIQIITLFLSIILIPLILFIPSLFEFSWNQHLRDLLPNTEHFWRIITEFGGTLIYLGVFFIIFWGINKEVGRSLLTIYVASNFVNFYAKAIIANKRPPESDWLLISASHLSTPSGHAMSATVFWGYLAMVIKKLWIWITFIILIILIGISRMYLGVHWFGDILTGWLFGITILCLVVLLKEPLNSFLSDQSITKNQIYIGLAIFGLIVMLITEILYSEPTYNFGTPGGQMIGLGIGFFLENKYVNFKIEKDSSNWWRLIMRILIGLLIVLSVYLALDIFLSSSIFWQSAIQFALTLIAGIFIWPLIFKKIKL
jgi:membrane-associated phospholipid phosphatase